MRVLGVTAHPDDELAFAGLLRKAVLGGGDAHVLCFSGNKRRAHELRRSCAVLGATQECLFFPDGGLADAPRKRLQDVIILAIRTFKPDVVATLSPYDYHPDHQAVLSAVKVAVEFAGHGAADEAWMAHRLLLFETNNLIPEPDVLIDIDDVFEDKMRALEQHGSELRAKHKKGLLGLVVRKRAELRGAMAGCLYAEACVDARLPIHGSFYARRRAIGDVEELVMRRGC